MQRLKGRKPYFLCAGALVTTMLLGDSRLQAYRAQKSSGVPTALPQLPDASVSVDSGHDTDPGVVRQQQLRVRMAEDERHKRMVKDADKLLELATELKTEVDKSSRNETSVSALRKADEIEKLAHDVKERLKN